MAAVGRKYISEIVRGIVQRVTYHDPVSGWSVLRVESYDRPGEQVTVTVHQTKVFAGATMEFKGAWTNHPQFGRQFKAAEAVERKPASAAALEKYLGSGLIKGVGPKTAKKIVAHFGAKTLDVFEKDIERLTEIEGIAHRKLVKISEAWTEHRLIRDVMIFLQGHNISTLFAVRIFKKYGDKSIELVTADPYRLAIDFYGIGFFSADQVALSIGLAPDSRQRIVAAIRHQLSASRDQGHCFLTLEQIIFQVSELLELKLADRIPILLEEMDEEGLLKARRIPNKTGDLVTCYYSKSLYYAEQLVADTIGKNQFTVHEKNAATNTAAWIENYCRQRGIQLSDEQAFAVQQVADCVFSVLTGGPGCGKTTTTLVIVRLLEHLGMKVLLAAPTGRAAQRMSEVIGQEAKTLHRLLEWKNGDFTRNENHTLEADVIIVDECSMLDISLTASLFQAIPEGGRLLMIGDADQLPPVGAGQALLDIIHSGVIPVFRLTQVFRQAQESHIIGFAHDINHGQVPPISSPFKKPELWNDGSDCLFIDSDEPTKEQMAFVSKVKRTFQIQMPQLEALNTENDLFTFRTSEPIRSAGEPEFSVPEKFKHVDLQKVADAKGEVEELKAVLKKIHPWSTLHYGLSAIDTVVRLYTEWIPKYYGKDCEIQILSPMTRGSLGTVNLNKVIQSKANPPASHKPELQIGERVFRVGDRVIHKRNNYDLGVFNGDIGKIIDINGTELTCTVSFFPNHREVEYQKDDMVELDHAFAISIHKSQGSEFQTIIIPVHTQHFRMLYRNLIYTGLTRARKLAAFVGTRRALSMAVRQKDTSKRQTALSYLLRNPPQVGPEYR